MTTPKAQPTTVRGKELVRRRFYMSDDVWSKLEKLSIETNKSPSELVEQVLRLHL